jgi:hypothetical protein
VNPLAPEIGPIELGIEAEPLVDLLIEVEARNALRARSNESPAARERDTAA